MSFFTKLKNALLHGHYAEDADLPENKLVAELQARLAARAASPVAASPAAPTATPASSSGGSSAVDATGVSSSTILPPAASAATSAGEQAATSPATIHSSSEPPATQAPSFPKPQGAIVQSLEEYARQVGVPEIEIPNLLSYAGGMGGNPTNQQAVSAYASAINARAANLAEWQRQHDAWARGLDESLYDISNATIDDILFLYRHGELMQKVRPGLLAQQMINWAENAGPKPRPDLPDSHPSPFAFNEAAYNGPLRALLA